VICSADNERQIKAIIENIDKHLRQDFGMKPRVEGSPDTGWVLIDTHDIVVHVFHQTQRDYYRLDQLWNRVPPLVVVQ
jgi:ribosome-associated protein